MAGTSSDAAAAAESTSSAAGAGDGSAADEPEARDEAEARPAAATAPQPRGGDDNGKPSLAEALSGWSLPGGRNGAEATETAAPAKDAGRNRSLADLADAARRAARAVVTDGVTTLGTPEEPVRATLAPKEPGLSTPTASGPSAGQAGWRRARGGSSGPAGPAAQDRRGAAGAGPGAGHRTDLAVAAQAAGHPPAVHHAQAVGAEAERRAQAGRRACDVVGTPAPILDLCPRFARVAWQQVQDRRAPERAGEPTPAAPRPSRPTNRDVVGTTSRRRPGGAGPPGVCDRGPGRVRPANGRARCAREQTVVRPADVRR